MDKLLCACGEELEEGLLTILWCPKCGTKWKIPEDQKDDKRYYFTIKRSEDTDN